MAFSTRGNPGKRGPPVAAWHKKKTEKRRISLKRHECRARVSTGTAIALIFQMDVDRVTEFAAELLSLFLRQSTPGNN